MFCSRVKKNLKPKEHPGTSTSQHKSFTQTSCSLGCEKQANTDTHPPPPPPVTPHVPKVYQSTNRKALQNCNCNEIPEVISWGVHTPTETFPFGPVKNIVQINLPDVLSYSSGVCIIVSEDADPTASQCHQTSDAPPVST